jgi:hypothetical protein
MCGPGAPLGRRRRAAAGLGIEPESGSRSGMTPIGGARLVVGERKGRREGAPVGPLGREGRETRKSPARLGCVVKKRKAGWAGPCGRKKKKREEEKEMGRAKRKGGGAKEKHSNAFESKFEI